MQTNLKSNNRNHALEILVPFLGVFAPYKISVIPVTAIMLFIIVFFRNKGTLFISKQTMPYLIFVLYRVFRDVVHMFFSVSDPIDVQVKRLSEYIVLNALIIIMCNYDFDERILFKWWKIAGTVFGAGMVYHVVQLLIFHQSIQPISLIPGYIIYNEAVEDFTRPTSFFSEPAAYVVSMLPLLFLSLKRRNLKWAVIATFLIMMSTSTIGVVLSALLWVLFILFEKKSMKTTVISLTFVFVFVVLFMYLPLFSDTLEKLQEVSVGASTWGSRVKGPFEMISVMKWYELPFGTNILDTREFVFRNLSSFKSGSVPVLYVNYGYTVFLNTIAMLIYRYGITGLCLFLFTFKNKMLNKHYEARMYAIMMIVAAFAQGSVASPDIGFIIVLLYANKKRRQNSSVR
ncbi:MAG: hypothetical protein J1F37_07520 [Oscillospiraceae bacterium]|nr:hypothetical protein [Oscillospiraceae bacterium]